jgi:tRNA A-37 threonylcarbamoyl transferase component Bud32
VTPEDPTPTPGGRPTTGTTDTSSFSPGDPVGSYVVTRRIGQGGMGVVYEATDPLLRRSVAVKVLRSATAVDELAADRFLAEARAAARLHHPNVVTIYEIDRHDGGFVLVMELVPGGSAQDRLRASGPFPWVEATRLAADACRGLVAAHAAGVIHLDVKPANLLLNPTGAGKLADFGLARLATPVNGTDSRVPVCGTPAFMSPEQCRGEIVDPRTDLYSLGATYFALLTGSPPYPSETDVEMMLAHCTSPVPDPRRRDATIPPGCAAVVARAMAKEPADRFATTADALTALESLLPPLPAPLPAPPLAPRRSTAASRRRPLRRTVLLFALVVVAVAAVAVAGAMFLRNRSDGERPSVVDPVVAVPTRERLAESVIDAGGEVEAVAFTRDDRLLVWVTSGTNTNGIRQLDTRTGHRSFAALPHRAYCLALSPDGRTAVVGTSDSRIQLFDTSDGLTELPGIVSPGGSLRSIAISPDGRWLAAGLVSLPGETATLRVWRWGTNEPSVVLTGHTRGVGAVAFSPDGKTLASAGHDGNLILRETETWAVRKTLPLDGGEGWALAYSADGNALAAAAYGKGLGVPVWDAVRAERVLTFHDHAAQVAAVAFAPTGRLIASGGADGVRLWDRDTGKQTGAPIADHDGGVLRGLAFSHDGAVLVTGASDRTLRVRHTDRLFGGNR